MSISPTICVRTTFYFTLNSTHSDPTISYLDKSQHHPSTIDWFVLLNGHHKGPGVNDPSCRHHYRCHTIRGKKTNNEEGASQCPHCCHVSGRRADKGGGGQRRAVERSCRGSVDHLKSLGHHSIFLASCDTLLGGGRSKKKPTLSQPQSQCPQC